MKIDKIKKNIKELEKQKELLYKQFKEISEKYDNDMFRIEEGVVIIDGLIFEYLEEIKEEEEEKEKNVRKINNGNP